MKVVIVGAGRVGYYLAQALLSHKHQVTVVERDSASCDGIVRGLKIVAINGDGTDIQTLTDADAASADVLVALTGSDQDNLVACQLASKRFEVGRTIARVSNPKNRELFEKLGGVTTTLSSTDIICRLIEEQVSLEDVITLMSLKEGEASIVQVEIAGDSPARNKRVMDLSLPDDCVIISVFRGDRLIFPRGLTKLRANDRILAVTTNEQKVALQDALGRE